YVKKFVYNSYCAYCCWWQTSWFVCTWGWLLSFYLSTTLLRLLAGWVTKSFRLTAMWSPLTAISPAFSIPFGTPIFLVRFFITAFEQLGETFSKVIEVFKKYPIESKFSFPVGKS